MIPADALPHFENMIYLPMVIKILERDRETIEISPFKLRGPYIKIVEDALKNVRAELKATNTYARNRKLKLIKKGKDNTFTEYVFVIGDNEDVRRYLNVRLRNRAEELINLYFEKGMLNNARTHS
ncbi:hypothetical protein MKY34_19540 [Sporosarcina sp. FSL K6-1522]|uniref:hypothetical protein n=1 Tax=Sporosarcina sp. FSL K6-1522 TaxID=2921554 RepID=UPI00315AD179